AAGPATEAAPRGAAHAGKADDRHPSHGPAAQDAAEEGAGHRDQQQDAEDVREESRRDQEGAPEDDEEAVGALLARHPSFGERLVEAAPGRPALVFEQPGAEDRVEEEQE